MSLRVEYVDAPEGAQEAAVASATSGQPFGMAQQIAEGAADTPWATLEPGGWVLDGTRKILPDAPSEIGWWSAERSGDDGYFANAPKITVSLGGPYTATGLSFRFWSSLGQWCNEILVSWYRGDEILTQTTAYPDEANWVLSQAVEDFDKVEIYLIRTNMPGQFAKLQQLQIGHVVVFLQDELVRVSLLNEIDPSLAELTVDTMSVEIQDKKNRNLIPQKNQLMYLYRDEEHIAAQYITDSSRESQQHYVFQCQSAIGRLEDEFSGGFYYDKSVAELLAEVLEGFAYQLDEKFLEETVTGNLTGYTRREVLQQIAFAIGAVVTTQGDGTIWLSPIETQVKGKLDGSTIFTGAKVSREARVATVQILAHNYTSAGEDDPFWVSKTNVNVSVPERGNIVTVDDAALVSKGNAQAVLDRLYDYYTRKNVLTQDVVVSGQRAGQLVQSPNPWGTLTEGYITSMDSEFTGSGHTASITIRGREVAEG